MASCFSECWRPPLFLPATTGIIGRLWVRVRRFLDLQAGSAWRDMSAILPEVEGILLDVDAVHSLSSP